MYLEKVPENSYVPSTAACLTNEQLYRYAKGDIYHYLNENNPHPFTKGRL